MLMHIQLQIEKSVLILEKKAVIVSTFELNFPFKMQLDKYLGFSDPLWGLFFIEVP